MSSLMEYNGIQVVTPDPCGLGGLAINNNFKALSTPVQSTDPTAADDSTAGFAVGPGKGVGNGFERKSAVGNRVRRHSGWLMSDHPALPRRNEDGEAAARETTASG